MVLIHLKKGQESLYLWQAECSVSTQDLLRDLVGAENHRQKLVRLVAAMEDLVQYGPWKPVEEHGYSMEELEEAQAVAEQEPPAAAATPKSWNGGEYQFRRDPTGRRNGYAPLEPVADTLRATLQQATNLLSPKNVELNKVLALQELQEMEAQLRAAVTIAYPMGLPAFDPVQEILDGTEDLTGSAASKDVFALDAATLWWANKELVKAGKTLGDFIGRNEKTKLVVKLQKKGQGAPTREPPVDERAQKEMMAYYYKKQEEHKKLMENTEDDYLHSSWANSKSLKQCFNGMAGDVSWKPR